MKEEDVFCIFWGRHCSVWLNNRTALLGDIDGRAIVLMSYSSLQFYQATKANVLLLHFYADLHLPRVTINPACSFGTHSPLPGPKSTTMPERPVCAIVSPSHQPSMWDLVGLPQAGEETASEAEQAETDDQ